MRFAALGDPRFDASAAGPVRRPLLREGPWPLDEVIRAEQGGDSGIFALFADRRLQAGRIQPLHDRLLRGADGHRTALPDLARPAAVTRRAARIRPRARFSPIDGGSG